MDQGKRSAGAPEGSQWQAPQGRGHWKALKTFQPWKGDGVLCVPPGRTTSICRFPVAALRLPLANLCRHFVTRGKEWPFHAAASAFGRYVEVSLSFRSAASFITSRGGS